MTKEELKQEAEEYALKQWEGNLPWSVIQKSYYDGALPREKQIQIDAEQIRALQKQNGELTDKVKELEAEVFFLKDNLNHEVELHQHAEEYIKNLEAQIEKMQGKLKSDLIARLKEKMIYSTSPSCTKGMELFIESIEKWEIKER